MRTRKKEKKKRNEEKQDLQKVQKRENRETIKIRTKKRENSNEKRREEKIKQKMVHTENNEKDKYFGWPGRTVRGALPVTSHMFFVAICLLRFPTCTQLLSQFI